MMVMIVDPCLVNSHAIFWLVDLRAFSLIMSWLQDGDQDKYDLSEEHKHEITESMRLEMEYNSDRAW